jgi:UDP-N-acetylglucosamine transferase subunit ALG13
MARILVCVGTDHHPFERLVAWAERWQRAHPEHRVEVQHGHSRAPSAVAGIDFVGRAEMRSRYAAADVVVVSCGPGAVMDARAAGRRPIVVPRLAALGEHVDDHQQAFAALLHERGLAVAATDVAALDDAVAAAVADPDTVRVDRVDPAPTGPARFTELVEGLLDRG